ncbi:hypothetical protein LEMLEM_LOCUS819, partial [Lemmus lemmus]
MVPSAPPVQLKRLWQVVGVMGFKVRIGQKCGLYYFKVLTGTELCWQSNVPTLKKCASMFMHCFI